MQTKAGACEFLSRNLLTQTANRWHNNLMLPSETEVLGENDVTYLMLVLVISKVHTLMILLRRVRSGFGQRQSALGSAEGNITTGGSRYDIPAPGFTHEIVLVT
jgi:hypothetical protein